MNTNIIINGRTTSAALLVGCILAATSAFAQDQTGSSEMPKPRVKAVSCDEVDWQGAWDRELLSRFPNMAQGCHEVVVRDGQKWIRFAADFVRRNNDGSIVSDFKSPRDRSIGTLTLQPAPGQRVLLDGREYSFSELKQGQSLNFYVPEGTLAFATAPEAPSEQLAQVVVEEPTRLAEVDRSAQRETPQPSRLPSTAGPLPFFAAGSLAFLMGGLGLAIRRRIGGANS